MNFIVTVIRNGHPITAITDIQKFSKSEKYCKAHIIAKPNLPAHLHYLHIELNLNIPADIKGIPDLGIYANKWKSLITSHMKGKS